LSKLFHRGDWWFNRNDDRDFRMLIGPYEYGLLRVAVDRAPKMVGKTYPSTRSESDAHLHMKDAAASWLRSRGAKHVEHEVRMHGGRADVFSRDLGIVVECGDTRVGKLYSAITDKEIKAFCLIPYQHSLTRFVVATITWDPEVAVYVNDELRKFMREATNRLPTPSFTDNPHAESARDDLEM
jgi:hypothetical protein